MGAVESDISSDEGWFCGADNQFQWLIDNGTVGTPPSGMASWTVLHFRLWTTTEASTPTLEKDASVLDANTGLVGVQIDAADTAELVPGTYFYTLSRVEDPPNEPLAYGSAVLHHPVVA